MFHGVSTKCSNWGLDSRAKVKPFSKHLCHPKQTREKHQTYSEPLHLSFWIFWFHAYVFRCQTYRKNPSKPPHVQIFTSPFPLRDSLKVISYSLSYYPSKWSCSPTWNWSSGCPSCMLRTTHYLHFLAWLSCFFKYILDLQVTGSPGSLPQTGLHSHELWMKRFFNTNLPR